MWWCCLLEDQLSKKWWHFALTRGHFGLQLNQEPFQSSQAVYLTLLSVADNHKFLASIAGSVHGQQQLSDILLNLEFCLRDEDDRFCFGKETRLMLLKWPSLNALIVRLLPSPGSTISTVADWGNSSRAITGSDSSTSKVSEFSNCWSARIFTFQLAVVWPGLNWTCFWALPRKSLSFFAVPSTAEIPRRKLRSDSGVLYTGRFYCPSLLLMTW